MAEAICLAFNVKPSRLRKVYAKYSMGDVRMTLRLFLGNKVHTFTQDYQTMAMLLSQVFGSGEGSAEPARKVPEPVKTLAEFEHSFKKVFGAK